MGSDDGEGGMLHGVGQTRTISTSLVFLQLVTALLCCSLGIVGVALTIKLPAISIGYGVVSLLVRGCIFLLSGNILCMGLVLMLASIRTLTRTIRVNAHGLSVTEAFSRKLCRWRDLRMVRRSTLNEQLPNILGFGAIYDVVSLEFANGVCVRMGPAENFRVRLVAVAERKILSASRENMLSEIEYGDSIDFNSVIVSDIGLHRGKRTIRWDTIDSVSSSSGDSVVIRARDGLGFSVTVGKTFNPNLLLSLVKMLTQKKAMKS